MSIKLGCHQVIVAIEPSPCHCRVTHLPFQKGRVDQGLLQFHRHIIQSASGIVKKTWPRIHPDAAQLSLRNSTIDPTAKRGLVKEPAFYSLNRTELCHAMTP